MVDWTVEVVWDVVEVVLTVVELEYVGVVSPGDTVAAVVSEKIRLY